MSARVELRDITRRGGLVLERTEVVIDPRDEDECVLLLRQMAKRHKLKPADAELRVYTRKTGEKRYRTV